jgi:hypothetical protein
VDFIKMDVEGAELSVLRGAAKTIDRDRPTILFEHSRPLEETFGVTPPMVYDEFARHSMRIAYIPDWLAGDLVLSREEFIAHRGGNFIALPS